VALPTLAQVPALRPARTRMIFLIVIGIAGGGYLAFWAVGTALERGHIPGIAAKPTEPTASTDAATAKES
jgi:hypothetical protein